MHVRFSVRIFFRGVLESPYDGYMGRRGANVLLCVSNANAMQSCSDDDKGLTAHASSFQGVGWVPLVRRGLGTSLREAAPPSTKGGGNRRPAHPRLRI